MQLSRRPHRQQPQSFHDCGQPHGTPHAAGTCSGAIRVTCPAVGFGPSARRAAVKSNVDADCAACLLSAPAADVVIAASSSDPSAAAAAAAAAAAGKKHGGCAPVGSPSCGASLLGGLGDHPGGFAPLCGRPCACAGLTAVASLPCTCTLISDIQPPPHTHN